MRFHIDAARWWLVRVSREADDDVAVGGGRLRLAISYEEHPRIVVVREQHQRAVHPRRGTPRAGRRLDPADDDRGIVVDAVGAARLAGDGSAQVDDAGGLRPLRRVGAIAYSRAPVEADDRVPVARDVPDAPVAIPSTVPPSGGGGGMSSCQPEPSVQRPCVLYELSRLPML